MQRYRERDNMVSAVITGTASIRENQHTPTHICRSRSEDRTTTFEYPTGSLETFSDYIIPGYDARSANGEVFCNPMSSSKTTRSVTCGTSSISFAYKTADDPAHRHCPDYYWESVSNAPVCLNGHGTPVYHLNNVGDVSSLRDYAGTEAFANIDSPTIDGAVFIAELHETLSYLKNPLRSFTDALGDVRRKKNRSKNSKANRQILGDYLRDQWLSYRYGFRPLAKEIENAAVAVAQTVLREAPKRKTARGSASDSFTVTQSGTGTYDSRVSFETETKIAIDVRAGVLYEYYRSPDTFGLKVERAPLAMWEAIPYSFVVDRFLNVGSFVEAITPKAGIRHLAAWTTVKTETTTQRTSRLTSQGSINGRTGSILSDGLTIENYSSITKTRTPGVKIGLALNAQPFGKDSLDVSFITDLVALGAQMLRTR